MRANAHLGRNVEEAAYTHWRIDDDAALSLAGAIGRTLQRVVSESNRLAQIAQEIVNAVARELWNGMVVERRDRTGDGVIDRLVEGEDRAVRLLEGIVLATGIGGTTGKRSGRA